MSKLYKLKNYKFILVIYVLILNTLGVFLVGSASPGDQKKQIIGMVSGIVIMVILSLIDYSFILRFSWIIYLLAVGLLALVLVAGDSSKGAQRWFEIGGIRFQPSELVKILLILFFRKVIIIKYACLRISIMRGETNDKCRTGSGGRRNARLLYCRCTFGI